MTDGDIENEFVWGSADVKEEEEAVVEKEFATACSSKELFVNAPERTWVKS